MGYQWLCHLLKSISVVKLSLSDKGGLLRDFKAIKYIGIMGMRLKPNHHFSLSVLWREDDAAISRTRMDNNAIVR